MKNNDDQIDFNFSRSLDFQKNLDISFCDEILKNLNLKFNNNLLFAKHIKFMILELFYVWLESPNQFLSVSMSKRGYHSSSRYNPNSLSSYAIRVINSLKEQKLIDFFPGFFDLKNNVRRQTRIRASDVLKKEFEKINLNKNWLINHRNREYLFAMDLKNSQIEYRDTFKSHEIREVLINYNNQLAKTLFDIPELDQNLIIRSDEKKIAVCETTSTNNFYFYENFESPENISGAWWNKFDLKTSDSLKKKLIINNSATGFIDLVDFFFLFLSKVLGTNVALSDIKDLDFLNPQQKCYLILKGIRSKNFQSFFRSLSVEKKNYFFQKQFSSESLKVILENFEKNNVKLTSNFFKQKNIKWIKFVSLVFFQLIKKTGDTSVPLFLVRDKIYFSLKFSDIITNKIGKILESELQKGKIDIKIYQCDSNHFQRKGFFGSIVSPRSNSSMRYLKRKNRYNI